MSEQTNTFRDSTLNLDQAYYYTLLLLVDTGSFAYGITFKDKLLAYEANCSISELTEPKQLQELFSVSYKKIIFGFKGNGFTLIPRHLFNTDRIGDFARLLDVKENEKVLAQVLDAKNHVVYKADAQPLSGIGKFSFKTIAFAAKGIITAIARNNPSNTNLYLNIGSNKVEFVYFNNGSLRFYNSFDFKNAEDVVYYSALVTNELEMQPANTILTVSGDINLTDELYNHLTRFFKAVEINKIQLLELPAQIAPHHIFSFAALSLCGSSEAL